MHDHQIAHAHLLKSPDCLLALRQEGVQQAKHGVAHIR